MRLGRAKCVAECANNRGYATVKRVKPDTGRCVRRVYGNDDWRTTIFPGFGSKVAARTRWITKIPRKARSCSGRKTGDEGAFCEIVERYQSKVFSIIHGIVRQRNDVEDIAQQVFAKVYLSFEISISAVP